MGKPKLERQLADNEAKAVHKMIRVSPQKLNLVAQLIRGKKAARALSDLEFSNKRNYTSIGSKQPRRTNFHLHTAFLETPQFLDINFKVVYTLD